MTYKATIKRRFKKSKEIQVFGEDEYWALMNIIREYPKHKILNINLTS